MVTEDGLTLQAEVAQPDLGQTGLGQTGLPQTGQVQPAVVLSHPHPLYGGDMWNPLIAELFVALSEAGLTVLRYNFRGVGSSQGKHGQSNAADAPESSSGLPAEVQDAQAAFGAAAGLTPAAELSTSAELGAAAELGATAGLATAAGLTPAVVSVGWSFGADVSLASDHLALAAWVGIAAPLQIINPTAMAAATDPRPKLLLVPEHDEFNPPEQAAQRSADWPGCTLNTIAGADHFLGGQASLVAEQIVAFINQTQAYQTQAYQTQA